jgi:hypothetical protein
LQLTQVSARFFLELALGLCAGLLWIDRRTVGRGFTRLTLAFVVATLVPALLLSGGWRVDSPAGPMGLLFGAAAVALLFVAGRPRPAVETSLLATTVALGAVAVLLTVRSQVPEAAPAALTLASASALASTLVLGLVTGAMLFGHWYLVTPDLPVAHLGRFTRMALIAVYAKLALVALAIAVEPARFAAAGRSCAALVGIGSGGGGSFQSQLDFLWLVARIAIGLIGPAVLGHMTLATIRLKATQPATGILYAATVMVLMGELFAFVAERSFAVIL